MKPEYFSCRIYGALFQDGKALLTRSRFPSLLAEQDFNSGKSKIPLPPYREFVNFPGGGVELGESPMDALLREYEEETGLTVKPARVLYASEGRHLSAQRPLQIVSIYWLVERVSGELRRGGNGDDVLDLFWSGLDALPTGEMFPSDLEFALRLPSLLREINGKVKL